MITFFLFFIFVTPAPAVTAGILPEGFIYARDAIPDIKIELRYYSKNNFIGKRIEGYLKPRCLLTKKAAEALRNVEAELRPFNLGLKIYDAYRPQQSVDHFIRWAKDHKDIKMKAEYYPLRRKIYSRRDT